MTLRSRVLAVLAGLCFIGYTALRPWSSKTLDGELAASFANPRWPLTHLLAMAGFVLLALLLRPPAGRVADPSAARTELLAWAAAALLLPRYGAEALAFHVLGQHVQAGLDGLDPAALALADAIRYSPWSLAVFLPGLVLLAVVGVRLARSCWPDGGLVRLAGALVALGLLTFLPAFFGSPVVRITHGLVLAAGLVLLALVGARRGVSAGEGTRG